MTNKNPNLDKVTNDSDISSEQKTAIEKRRNVLKGCDRWRRHNRCFTRSLGKPSD